MTISCTHERPEAERQPAAHDQDLGLTRADFRDLMRELAVAPDFTRKPGERSPRAILDQELQRQVDLGPPVSVSATTAVELKDLLLGLARQAERDIEIDPRIEGGVMLSVRDRPFLKVIERIADLANLRYDLVDDVLRIERDEPYNHTYRLNLLNLQRISSGLVTTSTNVLQGDGGGGNGNGSSNSVETNTINDVWAEVEATIAHLLHSTAPERLSAVVLPVAGTVVSTRDGEIVGEMIIEDENEHDLLSAERSALEGILGHEILDDAGSGDETADDGSDETAETDVALVDETSQNFTIDRAAGLINVYATQKQHRAVSSYLDKLRQNTLAQVLIEAKVFEVRLDENFETGINWRAVFDNVSIGAPLAAGSFTPIPGPFNNLNAAASNVFSVALEDDDIEGVISLIETFGTVRTLSSPRVTVMQNNTAVLKVAENQVFFRLDVEREEDENGFDSITVSSEINTVPVGVVITVQPSIDVDRETIMMALRPTITRIAALVDDPAVAIASNNTVRSQVPVVAVQEIDSVVEVESGRTIVMGGLMEEIGVAADQGVPGIAEVPLLGRLFKSRQEVNGQSELVIFLRATIVNTGVLPAKDRQLLDDFTNDPRPYGAPSMGF